MKFEWEGIWNNQEGSVSPVLYEETARAKVFGGWIISHITGCDHVNEKYMEDKSWTERRVSMVFIPDQKHEWEVETD